MWKMQRRAGDAMPPGVDAKLHRMIFAAPLSTAAYIVGLFVMTGASALSVGDPVMASICASALSLNVIRVVLVAKLASDVTRNFIYLQTLLGLGCIFSALMAALVIRAFQLGGNEAIAISSIAATGYLSGVLTRASVAPRLAVPHILTMFVPLIVATLVASDRSYRPISFLLTCFCIGCIDLSRIMHSQIAAQLLAEHRLHLAARIDCLTSLSNRIALDEALAERRGLEALAIVAMIDLDGFKTVNDSHGHAIGDGLLKAVGEGIRKIVTEQHLVARLGGDEFAVLFGAGASAIDASRVCTDIVRVVGSSFLIDGIECRIGASVGMAAGSCSATLSTIKDRADKALYVAKRQGRAQVVWSKDSPPLAPTSMLANGAGDDDLIHEVRDDALARRVGGC